MRFMEEAMKSNTPTALTFVRTIRSQQSKVVYAQANTTPRKPTADSSKNSASASSVNWCRTAGIHGKSELGVLKTIESAFTFPLSESGYLPSSSGFNLFAYTA